MAIVTFARDSEIYLTGLVDGGYKCRQCALAAPGVPASDRDEHVVTKTFEEMLDHLAEHMAVGHKVPKYALQYLQKCDNRKD